MNKKEISTKPLPGFMELTPQNQKAFDNIKDKIQTTFEKFGFVSIDTPTIERAEVLLAKAGGETEKQIYQFKKGDKDVALRFDLTIPLARYVVENFKKLSFPFRRYQIAKVYRGEKSQKGRYREFYQCDIDIVGDEKLSLINDAEIPSVIYSIFKELNFGSFVIKINNRKLINGLLSDLNLSDKSVEILRIIDKLDKVGKEKVMEMLKEISIDETSIEKIFNFLEINGSNEYVLTELKNLSVGDNDFQNGIDELEEVINNVKLFNVPDDYIKIDLSIARGLDYYTGTVYETVLTDYPEIGSVCSGGRYDDLAQKYSDRKFPGVGISIGLTRLFSQLKDAGLVEEESPTNSKVLIISMVDDLKIPLKVANTLRQNSIATEIYFEEGKVAKKMKYADKIAVPFVILIGEDEINSNEVTVKNMETGEQEKVSVDDVVNYFS